MAANRTKMIEMHWPTRITSLATGVSFAASTKHTTASKTLQIPESTSRAFKSVTGFVEFQDEFGAAISVSGVRIGCKLGAAAEGTAENDFTATNTGDHQRSRRPFDFTAYFVTNFGTGATQVIATEP